MLLVNIWYIAGRRKNCTRLFERYPARPAERCGVGRVSWVTR
jgi:hypothetical protein